MTFRQLPLCISFFFRHVRLAVPTNVFRRIPHCKPEALQVMAGLRVDVGHITQEEVLKYLAVEFLWVLLYGLPAHSKDSARLETD